VDDVAVPHGYRRLRTNDKVGVGGIEAGVFYFADDKEGQGTRMRYTMELGSRQWSLEGAAVAGFTEEDVGPFHGMEANSHRHSIISSLTDFVFIPPQDLDDEWLEKVAVTFGELLREIDWATEVAVCTESEGAHALWNGLTSFSRLGLGGSGASGTCWSRGTRLLSNVLSVFLTYLLCLGRSLAIPLAS
jgi:hypothetical protein